MLYEKATARNDAASLLRAWRRSSWLDGMSYADVSVLLDFNWLAANSAPVQTAHGYVDAGRRALNASGTECDSATRDQLVQRLRDAYAGVNYVQKTLEAELAPVCGHFVSRLRLSRQRERGALEAATGRMSAAELSEATRSLRLLPIEDVVGRHPLVQRSWTHLQTLQRRFDMINDVCHRQAADKTPAGRQQLAESIKIAHAVDREFEDHKTGYRSLRVQVHDLLYSRREPEWQFVAEMDRLAHAKRIAEREQQVAVGETPQTKLADSAPSMSQL